eukprot:TRINITY_DN6746_c0_g1_i19.p1 TRINITY_DN6746_c0_g1~~TRINITY_DN6746_c0_g1_i19.p1  ORF type:complete len:180 (+),score=15.11 TRINITY_DN6746_c0_g1_i19:480-1019(+)
MTLCECAKYILEVLKVAIRAIGFFRHCEQSASARQHGSCRLPSCKKRLRSLMPAFSFRNEILLEVKNQVPLYRDGFHESTNTSEKIRASSWQQLRVCLQGISLWHVCLEELVCNEKNGEPSGLTELLRKRASCSKNNNSPRLLWNIKTLPGKMQVELLHVQKLPLLASDMTLCECAKYI